VGEIAVFSALASVASAGASLMGGIQGRAAAAVERRQVEEQARLGALQAKQAEDERRKDLTRTLATQDAIRGARGVDLFSPTGTTIRDQTLADAEADIENIRLNQGSAAARYQLAGQAASMRGTAALVGGIGGAAGGLLSGARALSDLNRARSPAPPQQPR
jgi:hypothetical protein